MTHYIVLQTMKTPDGQGIVKQGDTLSLVHPNWGCYGKDKRNLFWTDSFLDSKPQLFQKIKHS